MNDSPTTESAEPESPRRKRSSETDKGRAARLESRALERSERVLAEDKAVDAAIRRSIKDHGA